MNALFAREVYIRLTDGDDGFVCTVKYGRFYTKVTEVPMNQRPATGSADEPGLVLLRKRRASQAFEEQ